ncbi:FG-GAP-like repeat-containing protein [Paucibacter sp. R3-3]|uniref:FG-GAP-like repeat-containing protein n=1 Tax=Roseateles agri TaxID=3098619 RepID=A0ABU5DJR5_9BURK|nr:FG-GAP-like repeat-containing protein [Paucibacter sp. R3-3]MDY0746526.1 FG-GAP-like repeat-containing protein [Paucibacter sp. R3-3]
MAALSACGGGGGGGGDGGSSVDGADLSTKQYLPLQTGSRWVYQYSDGDGAPVIQEITGTRSVSGNTGAVMSSTDPDDGESVLVETGSGISQVPGTGADPLTLALGPVQLMKYPMHVGDSFTAAKASIGPVVDFDGDGKADSASVTASTQVIGVESISTAVGSFSDALHLRTTVVASVQSTLLGRTVDITSVTDDWYASRIGLVSSSTSTSSAGVAVASYTEKILGYKVGGQSSDTVAPTASVAGLDGSTPLGPLTKIAVTFSKAMDARTLANALQVFDAAGQPVAGSISSSSTGLQFTPATAWASGSYTAVLAVSAQDLLGNPLATEQRWAFTIDATAPSLLQSTPANGAADVPLSGALQLQFSEAVDPATVNAQTISIGSYNVTLSYQVSGSMVTLTPAEPMRRGTSYWLYVNGVKDLAGNAISPLSIAFNTDPGRFGAAVKLPLPTADSNVGDVNAIGDLDGDGRADIAASVLRYDSTQGGWVSGVQTYLQQPDGSLALGPSAALPTGYPVTSVAIADVDGDGRNELLAGMGEYGVQVFLRDGSGAWVPSAIIPVSASPRIQMVDLNGDGRPDLVAFGNRDTGIIGVGIVGTVEVWLNLPGGWMLNDRLVVGDFGMTASDLVVGDLNSDGRPDIAFSGSGLSSSIRVAAGLLPQGGDGHFSAVSQWFSAGNGGGAGLAVADFNGDGRPDVALYSGYGPIFFYLQNGGGNLVDAPAQLATNSGGGLKALDINGDGLADLVYDDGTSMVVRLQLSSGGFADEAHYPHGFHGGGADIGALAVGDFNSDGRPDVVVSGELLIQRPVPVNSQAVRSARPAAAGTDLLAKLKQAFKVLAGASRVR